MRQANASKVVRQACQEPSGDRTTDSPCHELQALSSWARRGSNTTSSGFYWGFHGTVLLRHKRQRILVKLSGTSKLNCQIPMNWEAHPCRNLNSTSAKALLYLSKICAKTSSKSTLGATTVLCVSAAPDHRPASLAALQLGFMPALVSHRVRSAGAKALCTTTRSTCSGAFSTCTAKARPCCSSGSVHRRSSNTYCRCFTRNNERSKKQQHGQQLNNQ